MMRQNCNFTFEVTGGGKPVVFVQGVGVHGGGWRPQTDELRSGYSCLTFDNRGMGRSQPAGLPITLAQMAADTLAVMDAAGIGAAHLVGHSLGGCVAQQVALERPERVRSLALLCTSARGADATGLSLKMAWLGARTRIGTLRMRRRAFLEMVMSAQGLASCDRDRLAVELAPVFGHDLGETPGIAMAQLRALSRFDVRDRLRELAGIPTLVVSAAQDIIFPAGCGKALAEGIGSAQFLELEDAAHGAPIEHAAAVNSVLREHFERVDGR